MANLDEQLNGAILAHAKWKTRLRDALQTGKCDVSVTDAGKNNVCPFGQWLYGSEIQASDKKSAHYETVCKLHTAFHQKAAMVLDMILKGQRAEAEKHMQTEGDYTKASADLTHAVTEWKSKQST
ncbi:MAG: CZB domain-containing protein [Alphaproteobacteria bacterium]|nr:MAG: CZB domain-containing protein [Alphaproteobacteria bacterium]